MKSTHAHALRLPTSKAGRLAFAWLALVAAGAVGCSSASDNAGASRSGVDVTCGPLQYISGDSCVPLVINGPPDASLPHADAGAADAGAADAGGGDANGGDANAAGDASPDASGDASADRDAAGSDADDGGPALTDANADGG